MHHALAFSRYALVGAAATGLHYALLVALVEAGGVDAAASSAVGATAGAMLAYAGNRRLTFATRASHRQALPRFALVAAAVALANAAIVRTGVDGLGLHYLWPQLFATGATLAGGYALNRAWTFA